MAGSPGNVRGPGLGFTLITTDLPGLAARRSRRKAIATRGQRRAQLYGS